MAVVGLDHVQLAMPEGREEDARGFYVGALGLREVPKPPDLARRGGVWLEGGGEGHAVRVHLGVERDFRPARKAHPAFVVRDLAGLAARLRERGVEPAADEPLPGFDRLYVNDPFGNRIELMEPRPARDDVAAPAPLSPGGP